MRLKIVLLFMFAAVGAAGAQGQQARETAPWTYNIRSHLVQFYLTVTEGPRRVTGLDKSAFSLKEDGIPREVHRLDAGEVPLQIALLLDTSGSMRESLPVVQEAAVYFLQTLRPADRVTLVPFNVDIHHISQLTNDRQPLVQAIRSTQARGATKLYDALLYAMKLLADKEGRKAIVAFSDGQDTGLSASLDLVQSAAARYGFPIYTIGAGAGLRSDDLRRILLQIAEINGGRTYYVKEPGELRTAFEEVGEELRSAYVLNYYTTVPHDGRWHDVSIQAANPRYRVHTRRGFYARTGGAGPSFRDAIEPGPGKPAAIPALTGPDAARVAQSAEAAAAEILNPAIPDRQIDAARIRSALASAEKETRPSGKPLFKVETRFVEVPVLVESLAGREIPKLTAKDFRIYENNTRREIAFFDPELEAGGVAQMRDTAIRRLRKADDEAALAPAASEPRDLVLGRVYLVLDNLSSAAQTFLEIKRAAERIVREQFTPFRPVSLHLTSDADADVLPASDVDALLNRIRRASLPAGSAPLLHEKIMNIHEAYLIDRGNMDAQHLAELRLAYSLGVQHFNELGQVDGQEVMSPEAIEREVVNTSRQLIALNSSLVNRVCDGLRVVVNAAAADPAGYPKTVIFVSSGVVLGFGELSGRLEHVLLEARRNGIRVFSIDAAGLTLSQPYSIESGAGYLVRNPHLTSLLLQHNDGLSLEQKSSLTRMAEKTGGRFFHSTNDLAGSAAVAARTTGRIFYLGYLSTQPADGRFHQIRVTTSERSVRLHARKGYYAITRGAAQAASETGTEEEDWGAVLKLAAEGLAAGNTPIVIQSLEKLTARFPDEAGLWYNLGAAYLKENNAEAAIERLQKGFALAPGDREIGTTLARALVAGGYTDAAADTLVSLLRRYPGDAELFLNLGRVYEAASRTAEAFQVYRSMLDMRAALPIEVYLALTRTSLSLGRKVEGALFIRDYLENGGDPSSVRPWQQERSP